MYKNRKIKDKFYLVLLKTGTFALCVGEMQIDLAFESSNPQLSGVESYAY